MFEVKQTHCGQYKRYGDVFREWDIITTESNEKAVLEYFFAEVYKVKTQLPEKNKWRGNIRYGAEHFSDPDYYFRGYYEIRRIVGGWHVTVCEPYAD